MVHPYRNFLVWSGVYCGFQYFYFYPSHAYMTWPWPKAESDKVGQFSSVASRTLPNWLRKYSMPTSEECNLLGLHSFICVYWSWRSLIVIGFRNPVGFGFWISKKAITTQYSKPSRKVYTQPEPEPRVYWNFTNEFCITQNVAWSSDGVDSRLSPWLVIDFYYSSNFVYCSLLL